MNISTSVDEKEGLLFLTISYEKRKYSVDEMKSVKFEKDVLANIPEKFKNHAILISVPDKLVCNLSNRDYKCTTEGTWTFDVSSITKNKPKRAARRQKS